MGLVSRGVGHAGEVIGEGVGGGRPRVIIGVLDHARRPQQGERTVGLLLREPERGRDLLMGMGAIKQTHHQRKLVLGEIAAELPGNQGAVHDGSLADGPHPDAASNQGPYRDNDLQVVAVHRAERGGKHLCHQFSSGWSETGCSLQIGQVSSRRRPTGRKTPNWKS